MIFLKVDFSMNSLDLFLSFFGSNFFFSAALRLWQQKLGSWRFLIFQSGDFFYITWKQLINYWEKKCPRTKQRDVITRSGWRLLSNGNNCSVWQSGVANAELLDKDIHPHTHTHTHAHTRTRTPTHTHAHAYKQQHQQQKTIKRKIKKKHFLFRDF